jgi:hypothetical protein
LGLEIREVKFGFSILSKNKPKRFSSDSEVIRIISPVRKRKGTLSFWGIGAGGTETEYEWQRRSLDKEDQRSLLQLQRGDVVEMSGIEDREEKRIRLSKAEQMSPLFVPRWEDLG